MKEEGSTLESRRIGRLHGSRAVGTAPCPETSNFNWDPFTLTGHQQTIHLDQQDEYIYLRPAIAPMLNLGGKRKDKTAVYIPLKIYSFVLLPAMPVFCLLLILNDILFVHLLR